jgi:site-specific recombinase XerD
MRISDILSRSRQDFNEEMMNYISFKTKFHHLVKISMKCRKILDHTPELFIEKKAEQKINEQLKLIATHLGIKKRLFFHVARHSFATNYLLKGGKLENLQKLMGHSKITTTMKYVHIIKEEAALTTDIFD